MGSKESRRIKAFGFFTQYLGTRALGDGEDPGSLSCKGFDYGQINKGAFKSYDFDWSQSKPYQCRCKPATWAGIYRYHDPAFAHSSPMLM